MECVFIRHHNSFVLHLIVPIDEGVIRKGVLYVSKYAIQELLNLYQYVFINILICMVTSLPIILYVSKYAIQFKSYSIFSAAKIIFQSISST